MRVEGDLRTVGRLLPTKRIAQHKVLVQRSVQRVVFRVPAEPAAAKPESALAPAPAPAPAQPPAPAPAPATAPAPAPAPAPAEAAAALAAISN